MVVSLLIPATPLKDGGLRPPGGWMSYFLYSVVESMKSSGELLLFSGDDLLIISKIVCLL